MTLQAQRHAFRPNIIFILADDLGYADLGCYGGRAAAFGEVSPELDRLAGNGILFTQSYANSPVCSPTRFALMTGRYQYRLRGAAEEPINTRARGNTTLGLPPDHPTLPSLLRLNGYRTALVGKWHLGYPPHFGPLKSGYDEFFGPISGACDYFTHCTTDGKADLWENGHEVERSGYLTDLLTSRAEQWIRESIGARAPFFLSLHYTAPHWPWEARGDEAVAQELKGRIFHLHGGNIHTYRRMIHHMDEGIGRLANVLRELGALDNTLIVFTSDNGGERFSDNWPLVGGKMDLTEGGIRVPCIAHWPAVIKGGGRSAQHCMTMDLSATMLEAAGAAADSGFPLDGISLMPVLANAGYRFDRPLYWRMKHRDQAALRDGAWKYLKVEDREYLFNIDDDERERANRAGVEPQRLEKMRDAWNLWNAGMPAIAGDATVSLGYNPRDMVSR